jgi:hypothetical protein
VAIHACNPSGWRLRQEDHEFQGSLGLHSEILPQSTKKKKKKGSLDAHTQTHRRRMNTEAEIDRVVVLQVRLPTITRNREGEKRLSLPTPWPRPPTPQPWETTLFSYSSPGCVSKTAALANQGSSSSQPQMITANNGDDWPW